MIEMLHETNDPNPSKLELMAQDEEAFSEIVSLIAASRRRALQAVNSTLIDLYWQVGETISGKIEAAEWGEGVVPQLAAYIARTQPGIGGFTRANLFRMRQFYATYKDDSIVAALLRQLPWTHHLIILGQSKRPEERELVPKLKDFLIELGRDFCFVGSEYPLQVGGRDFAIDLLFFIVD